LYKRALALFGRRLPERVVRSVLPASENLHTSGHLGGAALAGSPADFGKLITDETEKWANVIRFAGIKAG